MSVAFDHPIGPTTVEDWLTQEHPTDGSRLELIFGYLHTSPPPSGQHQYAVSELSAVIEDALRASGRTDLYVVPGVGVEISTPWRTALIPDVAVLNTKPIGVRFRPENLGALFRRWCGGSGNRAHLVVWWCPKVAFVTSQVTKVALVTSRYPKATFRPGRSRTGDLRPRGAVAIMATLLAFHAHPDDEALLNAGTLARAAAEGHRVVLVVATDGDLNGSSTVRLKELDASAAVLGVARTVHLGYADSGHGAELYPDPPGRTRFVRADTEDAARRLAALLREERVDVLLSYDANGGYGHRDHVQVHHVGKRAAELAGTPRVLESTMPRDYVYRMLVLARKLRLPVRYDPEELATRYSPATAITHRINVRRFARQKRDALAAHRSQFGGTGRAAQLMQLVLRLPAPVFGALFGREWFVEVS